MKSKYLTKAKGGFTLVELLVVLGIIGLLAAMGLPAMISAQRGSRNTTRLKQVEAVSSAMANYFSQYNDPATNVFPVANNTQQVTVGNSATDKRSINVQSTQGYNYRILTSCSQNSNAKEIYFYVDTANKELAMCKEGGGVQTIQYTQD